MPAPRGGQWLLALSVVGASGILLAFAWPMLQGLVYVHSDLARFHIPMRHFYSVALAKGWPALWCPQQFTGFYLHGEGQAVLAHPLNWLQYSFLPFEAAFGVELVRNYVFLLLGTYLFLRRWEVVREAAVFGALLFTFSSFNFLHFMHMNFVAIAAHLPWLLLAADVAMRSPSRRNAAVAWAAVSLLTASQLLHSHPQVTWMSLVAEGLYASYLLGVARRRRDGTPSYRLALRRLLGLGVAIALGFVTAAVQLLPMWESLQRSALRNDPDEWFLEVISLPAMGLIQLVAPYLSRRPVGFEFPEVALYCGAATPALLTWLLMRRANVGRGWPLARAALVLAGIALILALGSQGGLQRLERLLPVVGLFRAPARYILLAELGLCVAAAIAFADLVSVARGTRHGVRRFWPLAVPCLLGVLGTALLFWWAPAWIVPRLGPIPAMTPTSPLLIALGPGLVALAGSLVYAGAHGSRAACGLLVVLTAFDLGAYGLGYARRPRPVALEAWLASEPIPDTGSGERLDAGPFQWMMEGVRFAGGYAAMKPARTLPLGAVLFPRPVAMRVAAVGRSSAGLVPDPLPRARLVSRAEVWDEAKNPLARLARTDVATIALVDRPVSLRGGAPGSARIDYEHPGEIHVRTVSTGRQLLVLAESHHPGWSASVDGEACEIVRVYGDFMGCVVPSGEHRAVFRFEPESYRIGLRLSLLGLALTLAWPAVAMLRRRSGGSRLDSAGL